MSVCDDIINGDVHIPLCQSERCQRQLQQIASALEDYGVVCITKYELFGKYSKWFQKALCECSFTVLHQCPLLWKKIKQFESNLSDDDRKVIAVKFITEESGSPDCLDESFISFFEDQMTFDIKDATSLSKFAEKMVTYVKGDETQSISTGSDAGSKTETPQSQPEKAQSDNTSSSNPPTNNMATSFDAEDEDECLEESRKFDHYSDIFGESTCIDIYVISSSLQCSVHEEFLYSRNDQCRGLKQQINNFSSRMNSVELMSNLKFMLYKLLPTLYLEKNIMALSSIAACNESVLQSRALLFIELLLLTRRAENKDIDLKTLINVENLLCEALQDLRRKYAENKKERTVLAILQRLTNLYLMLLSEMIIACQTASEISTCDVQIRTVAARPFVISKSQDKSDECLTKLNEFTKQVETKKCSALSSSVDKYLCPEDPYGLSRELLKRSLSIQVIVIFAALKDVFKHHNSAMLHFLMEYIKPVKTTLFRKAKDAPSVCIVMVFRAMAHFLMYGLRDAGHKDIQRPCQEAMHVMNIASERDLPDEVGRLLQMLLCDNRPIIRNGVIRMFCDRKNYVSSLVMFLQNEVERSLIPLLTIDKSRQHTHSSTSSWNIVSGRFDNCHVLVHIHKPLESDHKDYNESKLHDQGDILYNQMCRLRRLRHKYILKLFAYGESKIPQFYITEDYLHHNLQTALKNRSDNRDFFNRKVLYKFLTDALCALEFCHSRDYVHRNLTAHSLFITNSKDSAKLSGFELCMKLNQIGKAAEQNCFAIPTRWSAPESLLNDVYSKASDVWMLGHLIYEVVTHGIMPYSHINKSDHALAGLIGDGQVSLNHDRCIEGKTFDVITQCADIDAESRPFVSNVKTSMEEIYRNSADSPHTIIPYPHRIHKTVQSSVMYKIGIPRIKREADLEDYNNVPQTKVKLHTVSSNLLMITYEDKLIFREKVKRKIGPAMLGHIKHGTLDPILPPIKIFKEDENSQIFECHVSNKCSGNLLDVTLKRALGNEITPYIYCLYKVALTIRDLYKYSWVIGDICAPHIYVEKTSQDLEVHIVSLAYLSYISEYNDMKAGDSTSKIMEQQPISSPPDDPLVTARAAPEVIKYGSFSPASDVFCFGNLLWEVILAFNNPNIGHETFQMLNSREEGEMTYDSIMTGQWETKHPQPDECPRSLYLLMKMCSNQTENKRPLVPQVLESMKRYLREECKLQAPDPETDNGAQAEESLPRIFLSEENPSVYSLSLKSELISNLSRKSSVRLLKEMNPSSVGSVIAESPLSLEAKMLDVLNPSEYADSVVEYDDCEEIYLSPLDPPSRVVRSPPRYLPPPSPGQLPSCKEEKVYEDIEVNYEEVYGGKNQLSVPRALEQRKYRSFEEDYLSIEYTSPSMEEYYSDTSFESIEGEGEAPPVSGRRIPSPPSSSPPPIPQPRSESSSAIALPPQIPKHSKPSPPPKPPQPVSSDTDDTCLYEDLPPTADSVTEASVDPALEENTPATVESKSTPSSADVIQNEGVNENLVDKCSEGTESEQTSETNEVTGASSGASGAELNIASDNTDNNNSSDKESPPNAEQKNQKSQKTVKDLIGKFNESNA